MKLLFFFFVFFTTITLTFSKGGRGGGGRGFSGARAGLARGYSRTKIGSTSSPSSFGSSSFRSTAFLSSLYFYHPIGRPYVIASGSSPIPYDNRTYHWSAQDANETYSKSKRNFLICQYNIGKDDGQLQNVTFANGTHPTSLFFGCVQDGQCCGMYCCEEDNKEAYVCFGIIIFLFTLFAIVGYIGQRNQNKIEIRNKMIIADQKEKPISNL